MTPLDNAALIARFKAEHLDRHSISPGRRVRVLAELDQLAAHLNGRTLAQLTPSDMMAWQGAAIARGLAPTTVTMRTSMLTAFVGWAADAGIIPWEIRAQLKSLRPVRGGETTKVRPRPYKRHEIERFRVLLDAEYPLIGRTGPGRLQIKRYFRGLGDFYGPLRKHALRLQYEAQVSLALEEGLRRAELHNVGLAHIAPDNLAVVVRNAKTKPGQERWREVPYTMHSRQCVQEWLDFRRLMVPGHDHPWLMLLPSRPTERQTFYVIEDALRRFEGDWKWHRFRHTFATERLRAGLPLEKLQIMMGHANLSQTLAYAEQVNADVQAEADRTEEQFARNLGLLR